MMRERAWWLLWPLVVLPACGSAEETGGVQIPVEPPRIVDLGVDANRDGLVDFGDEDQQGEDGVGADVGAVFLPNLDDDDSDGIADAADGVVNGEADERDLARVQVRPWPDAPDGTKGRLWLGGFTAGHVKLHQRTAGGWQQVAGALGNCGLNGDASCEYVDVVELGTDQLRDGVELGIEARHFAGGMDAVRALAPYALTDCAAMADRPRSVDAECKWTGLVEIQLSAFDSANQPVLTEDNPDDGVDNVALRVATWQMNHNLRPFDTVYFSDFSPALVSTLTPAIEKSGLAAQTYPDNYSSGWGDIWYEDWFQTGWTAMPAVGGPAGEIQGMMVFNPRPWGRDNKPEHRPLSFLRQRILGPDKAVAMFFDEATELDSGSTYDSHGNHEMLPPHEGAPVGRMLLGSGILQTTRDFYEAQLQPPVYLKTSWLIVGHMDEVYAAVAAGTPRGWRMIENSPALARKLFEDWEKDGHGDAPVFPGKKDYDNTSWETTVAAINADATLMAWNQEAQIEIDGMHDVLIAEAGLGEDDIIPVPVLYEEISGGKIAYLPDTANIRAIAEGNVAIFAAPEGPVVNGNDLWGEYLVMRMGDPTHGLGKDGKGLEVRFADSWNYHVLLGDVHCASNWSGLPLESEPMWWRAIQ